MPLFLKKRARLEEIGKGAGLPLGKGLTGWRKIVVGDRNWRIIFRVDEAETVATVWVIGDRDDAECYQEAQRRVVSLGRSGKDQGQAASLAAVMFQMSQLRRTTKRKKR